MKRALWLALSLSLSISACDSSKGKQPEAKQPKVVKLSDAELDKANLPMPEDFEIKARASIDEKSLEKQLETLEKQINADTK
jgi:hypothetical protein